MPPDTDLCAKFEWGMGMGVSSIRRFRRRITVTDCYLVRKPSIPYTVVESKGAIRT